MISSKREACFHGDLFRFDTTESLLRSDTDIWSSRLVLSLVLAHSISSFAIRLSSSSKSTLSRNSVTNAVDKV